MTRRELRRQAARFLADADDRFGARLLEAVIAAVREFLAAVRTAVLGTGGQRPDPDQFPTADAWLAIAHAHLDQHIEQVFATAYQAVLDEAAPPEEAGTWIYATEPFVEHHIDAVESRLRDWPAAVFEEIRHELREAYARNETTDQMRDRVGAVLGIDAPSREIRDRITAYDRDIQEAPDTATRAALRRQRAALYRDLRDEDRLWQWRANRIARTELTAAVNGGQYRAHVTLASAEDPGAPEPRKQWMATSDERTRPSHAAANGQVRELSEPFDVGGAPLMFPGDPAGPPGETINCRCALVVVPAGTEPVPLYPIGDQEEGGALAAAAAERPNTMSDEQQPSTPARQIPDGWRGILVPLESLSCDGRIIGAPAGDLIARPLPLPLLAQEQLAQGHDGAVVVGLIERAWIQDGAVWGEGRFDIEDDNARQWARRLGDGFAGWTSVDLDEATITEMGVDDQGKVYELAEGALPPEDHQIVLRADPWRLMSATLLSQQAFPEARITGLAGYSGPGTGTEIVQAAAPPFPPNTSDDGDGDAVWVPAVGDRVTVDAPDASGPGEVTAVDTAQDPVMVTVLLDAGGEVTVDVAQVSPEKPAEETGQAAIGRTRLIRSLAASGAGGPLRPSREWFDQPQLGGPTPLTVTEDGRVFGTLAAWETCHTGFPDVCVSPPASATGYSVFHTGEVLCSDGSLVPVGKITVGTGHADMQDGFQAALEHYDNTGTAVAVVRAYEDEYGITVAGALCPGVTPEQVAALRRSPLSGDWRRIGGHMELVAALCVNVPGFPVPRLAASVGPLGAQTSLVAAGRLPGAAASANAAKTGPRARTGSYFREVAAAAVDEYATRNRRRDAVMARMSADGGGPAWARTRAALAAARVRGDGSEQVIERAAAGHGYRRDT